MECGTVVVRKVDINEENGGAEYEEVDDSTIEIGLPELIKPGFSEFVMFEKQVGAIRDHNFVRQGCEKAFVRHSANAMSHWERGSRGRRVSAFFSLQSAVVDHSTLGSDRSVKVPRMEGREEGDD